MTTGSDEAARTPALEAGSDPLAELDDELGLGPPTAGLNLDRFNELLLDSAGVGLAIANPETLEVTFCNKRFDQWFPGHDDAEGGLAALLPVERADLEEAIEEGRPYRLEADVKVRHRPIHLAVTVNPTVQEGVDLLIVECQNISKLKELEYMVESYAKMVEKQTRDLQKEKERVERLLLNVMPRNVYEEWKVFGVTTPQRYDQAFVLMLDFVDFTEMAISRDPPALIAELNDIFTTFDRIVEQFGCERIKTIGDAYMAVAGIPESSSDDARNIARVALRFAHYLRRRNAAHSQEWRFRIGIAQGAVIGSIVGIQKYVYDIFGPGVNLAARLETAAEPMQIVVSAELAAAIQSDFDLRDLGERELKGFGSLPLFALEGSDEIRKPGTVPLPGW